MARFTKYFVRRGLASGMGMMTIIIIMAVTTMAIITAGIVS